MTFVDFVNENTEAEEFSELEKVNLLDKAHLAQLLILNGTINPSNTAIVSNDLLQDTDGVSFAVVFNGEVHKVRLDSIMSGPLRTGDQLAFDLGSAVGAKYVVTKKYPNAGFVIILDSDAYDGVDVDAKSNRRLFNLIKTKFAEPLKKLPSSQKVNTFMAESSYEDYADLMKSGDLRTKRD